MRITGTKFTGAFLVGTALLAGCQHQPPAVTPPPQNVEAGSTITLLAPLTFPAGGAELLFQGLKQVTPETLATSMPVCKLRSPLSGPSSLTPGPMKVTSVRYDELEAGRSGGMFGITTIMLAAGANQPDYEMRCGWLLPSAGPATLNSQQIYDAIGGQFSMQLLR
ncbi:MAG: hypothetical protein ACM3O5_09610 [Betaproteobacteria bacterium]